MQPDKYGIRKAMDGRLSALDSDPARRERIRQRIRREEEPVMKKKLTAGLVLAIVSALVLTSVALAVGFNLFDYFGQQDDRLSQLAPGSSLTAEPTVAVESPSLGTTTASINSAYYDGQSLLVGYIIQNGTRSEAFTPTDDQLSRMTLSDEALMPLASGEEEAALLNQYAQAIENGTPFGIATYSVYPSDHTQIDDDVDLPPLTEREDTTSSGMRYVIREYENPLPEEAQNRESLNIRIRLHQSATYLYFDGEHSYYLVEGESQEAGVMTASVVRVDAQTLRFIGKGSYLGISVTASAEISAVSAQVTITADSDDFPAMGDGDSWYELILLDENGIRFRTSECGLTDARTLSAVCEGTGKLPETLTAYLVVRSEGEWDEDAALAEATPVTLTADR